MDQNQDRRRGHFHRGRRGPDRRGPDRSGPQPQEPAGRNQVDVEQIMRDIRSRIAQRQGIELSNQQIQELAARRLESILDPRTIKPSLLDQMRRGAAGAVERAVTDAPELSYSFEDTTIYETHRAVLRFMRKLLNPLLKLFFNPNPLIQALNIQAKLNSAAAHRDALRDGRQAEWNALHYEIVQRLVTEVSRVSLELQSLSARIESLSAKVDFNERRVRGIEGTVHQSRRPSEGAPGIGSPASEAPPAEPAVEGQPAEGGRRRRRRRRGRRGGGVTGEMAPAAPAAPSVGPDAESGVLDQVVSGALDQAVDDAIVLPVTTEGEALIPRQEGQEPAPVEAASAPAWDPPPPPASSDEAPAAPPERPEPAVDQPDSGPTEQ